MKTAKWEQSSGALLALLNARPPRFVWGDLYTFTLTTGLVLRYTSADIDIGYSGTTWVHNGPAIDRNPDNGNRATAHWKVGTDVDTWAVTFIPRNIDPLTGTADPDKIGSIPWIQAAGSGILSGATATVDRAYFASWPLYGGSRVATPVGVVNIFTGHVAAVDPSRTQVGITINSLIELLTIDMPRNLYQAGCAHILFDSGCTLIAANFAANGAVQAGSTRSVIVGNLGTPSGSGTYSLGRIVMTSGNNQGLTRAVRSWDGTNFTLIAPFPFDVNTGDTFTAYPGCDKTQATCNKYANIANYKGEPLIPTAETAL